MFCHYWKGKRFDSCWCLCYWLKKLNVNFSFSILTNVFHCFAVLWHFTPQLSIFYRKLRSLPTRYFRGWFVRRMLAKSKEKVTRKPLSPGSGGEGYSSDSQNFLWGCGAQFSKPWLYFRPKNMSFSVPSFRFGLYNSYPFSDLAPVVQRADNFIQWISWYPADNLN